MKFKNTSDHIEAYIKAILEQSGIVELQRSQLADTFQVVPSQITTGLKAKTRTFKKLLINARF